MNDQESDSEMIDGWYSLLFGIRRSQRYHKRRASFFDNLDRWIIVSTIFGGGAAFATLGSILPVWVGKIAAGLIVLLGICALVFDFRDRSKNHRDWDSQYHDIEMNMIKIANPSEKDLQKMTDKRLQIEKDEPQTLIVLDAICHNEQLRAEGHELNMYLKMTTFQRFCAPFFDWCASRVGRDFSP